MVKNKTNKNYKRSQKGRSMVEMLGVLAIVGVLSVGGVYGYGVAMKKHKANEALHKASLMATTVSAYAMSNDGALPSTITDFTNSGYATNLSDNGTQFKLTVAGIGFDVCTQMKNVKGGMVQGVSCDETTGNATITYYKNLATDPAEGEKSPTGGSSFNPDGATEDDGSDCSADTKFGEECQVCVKGSYQDSDAKCDDGKLCVQGTCKTPADSDYTGCTRNSDCKGIINGIDCDAKTCYCDYYDYDEWGMRSYSPGNGPDEGSGVCMEATYQDVTVATHGINGKISTTPKVWYNAKNFCLALGGGLPSLSDFGINKATLGEYFEENDYCYGAGEVEKCEGEIDWLKFKLNKSWTKLGNSDDWKVYVDFSEFAIFTESISNPEIYAFCKI